MQWIVRIVVWCPFESLYQPGELVGTPITACAQICRHGTVEQKSKYLPKVRRGIIKLISACCPAHLRRMDWCTCNKRTGTLRELHLRE